MTAETTAKTAPSLMGGPERLKNLLAKGMLVAAPGAAGLPDGAHG